MDYIKNQYISVMYLQEMVELILQTHYSTIQYESTDNLLSETEFEALCSSHAACHHYIETGLIRDGKLQVARIGDDKKVHRTLYNYSMINIIAAAHISDV